MPKVIDSKSNERDEYFELVYLHPLKAIHSDEELEAATTMAESLLDRCTLSTEASDYLEALTKLIEAYERDAEPIEDATDGVVLAHLMDAKGVKQVDVARATEIADSTICDVLRDRRKFKRSQVGKIAKYFHVPVTVFSFDED